MYWWMDPLEHCGSKTCSHQPCHMLCLFMLMQSLTLFLVGLLYFHSFSNLLILMILIFEAESPCQVSPFGHLNSTMWPFPVLCSLRGRDARQDPSSMETCVCRALPPIFPPPPSASSLCGAMSRHIRRQLSNTCRLCSHGVLQPPQFPPLEGPHRVLGLTSSPSVHVACDHQYIYIFLF